LLSLLDQCLFRQHKWGEGASDWFRRNYVTTRPPCILMVKFKFVTSELYIGFTQLFLVRLTLLRSSLYNDWLLCARAFSLFLNQSFKLLLIQGRSLLWTFIAFSGAKVFKLSFIILVKLLTFCSQDRFGETTCQQGPMGLHTQIFQRGFHYSTNR
jgi:hypothetical protein